jgi:hypothetical protein
MINFFFHYLIEAFKVSSRAFSEVKSDGEIKWKGSKRKSGCEEIDELDFHLGKFQMFYRWQGALSSLCQSICIKDNGL